MDDNSPVRNRAFLAIWSADFFGQVGTQVTLLALPLLAAARGATALQVSLLYTCEIVAIVALSIPAGVWLDRHGKRGALVAADVVRFVVLGSVVLAGVKGTVSLEHLYAAAVATGATSAITDVGQQSWIPQLVSDRALVRANSLLEVTRGLAFVVGPAVGGLLIAVLSADLALSASGVLAILSAGALCSIPAALVRSAATSTKAESSEGGAGWRATWAAATAGIALVWRSTVIRALALSIAVANLFGSMVSSTAVLFALRDLGLSSTQLGMAVGIGNIGGILGGLLANRSASKYGTGRVLTIAACGSAVSYLLLGLTPTALALIGLTVGVFLSAFTVTIVNVLNVTLRQRLTPNDLLARMTAAVRMVVWGTIPIGSVLGGTIATLAGFRPLLFVAAIGSLAGVIPLLVAGVNSLREV